ncbi:hypothetical protein [Paraburkholderia aromaticivorans]|uniref:hypothetical protein n=1 Tax=Paraburkholderia aromaticivorans TaxID=2026199 RepID=UPI001456168C|nr:hypothetical protein [Paraburkholderia aromaticivorans]
MQKDANRRKPYALRRISAAVDRLILATSAADKMRAAKWANAWAAIAGLPEGVSRSHPAK